VGKPREREFCNRYQYLLTVFVFDSVTGVPSHVSQEKESRNPALASQEKKKVLQLCQIAHVSRLNGNKSGSLQITFSDCIFRMR